MKVRDKTAADGWLGSRNAWLLAGFLAVVGFFLITDHTAHFFGFLPYFLLLACPLLHWLHHGGHGSRDGDHRHNDGGGKK